MLLKLRLILLALLMVAPSGCEFPETSQSTLEIVLELDVIRIGTTGDYMPFSHAIDDKYVGLDIELAKDLASSLGVEVEFIHTSWPTLMDDLLADKFDIGMSGISITLERQKLAMFSMPVLSGGKVAISRDEDAERFGALDAINQADVRVIFNPGGTNEQFAREHFPNAQLVLNEDNITIFQKIVDGVADVMVTDAIETVIQQEIHPQLEAANPDAPFSFSQKAFLIKNDLVFKAYIDQWINLRLKDGTFDRMYDQQLNYFIELDDRP